MRDSPSRKARHWPSTKTSNVPSSTSYSSSSRTLEGPLEWNATLIEGELDQAVPALKAEHRGNLIVSGCGELAHALTRLGLVDEFWFWLSPSLWPTGPRIFDGVGPVRLELVAATPYRSGVLWLRYRPAA
ncbi:MAG TPA: dihydrofolate reductase family protein [Gaiellaceae bacterium]|nr:dihydrofolate reductase family protein [Gaiellaceae bacterium]